MPKAVSEGPGGGSSEVFRGGLQEASGRSRADSGGLRKSAGLFAEVSRRPEEVSGGLSEQGRQRGNRAPGAWPPGWASRMWRVRAASTTPYPQIHTHACRC